MKKMFLVRRLVTGLAVVSSALLAGSIVGAQARDIQGVQQIQRGVWQESTPLKSYTTYRRLCIDGLEFLSMEGYGWGESSSTSSQIIQVQDVSGKFKTCQ